MIKKLVYAAVFGFLLHGACAKTLETVQIQQEKPSYILDLKYPHGFPEHSINEMLEQWVQKKQRQFLSEVAKNNDLPASVPGNNGLSINYQIMYQQAKALSILFDLSTFMRGAAHPANNKEAFNFINGKPVSLENLFIPGHDYLKILSQYCRSQLLNNKDLEKNWVLAGTKPVKKLYKIWYFTANGIAIVFDTYQVAPYALGPQTIEIPRQNFKNILKPEISVSIWGS
ncbi:MULTISPECIES: DUF3298 and DUF4163 domain-containing protein [Legionella]|uniref:DUF3298 and DUF4163 domain-containing protein n=1 Tax=Legionella TaxID=445 RepID=UPI000F8E7434|nr:MULTISPECIES: DUF3298 and DUF4163 domain-containing protein [Legionella]MCP0913033.1 DUF3298 and DUF4163 domain-containing protein [Legionella sp. 27cVA30]RUQ98504.1 DUF3298 domain-containing protein [Legionella septentrionalis]RUR10890.1 DUF3298 domain-containing protein [Legionella septentrionalis]